MLLIVGVLWTMLWEKEISLTRRRRVARDESQEGKDRLALPHLHLRNLPHEACVPTKRRPLVLRRVTISEEQGELKCFNEPDDLDLRSGGERFGDIPTIERSAEAHVSGALEGHEQMFPRRSRSGSKFPAKTGLLCTTGRG
jgi:hypothetical protein